MPHICCLLACALLPSQTGAAAVKPTAAHGLAALLRGCRRERPRTDLYCQIMRELAWGRSCFARLAFIQVRGCVGAPVDCAFECQDHSPTPGCHFQGSTMNSPLLSILTVPRFAVCHLQLCVAALAAFSCRWFKEHLLLVSLFGCEVLLLHAN